MRQTSETGSSPRHSMRTDKQAMLRVLFSVTQAGSGRRSPRDRVDRALPARRLIAIGHAGETADGTVLSAEI